MDLKKNIDVNSPQKKLTRRGLAKLGTNMIFSGFSAAKLVAQGSPEVVRPEGVHVQTGPGWKNTASRAFGNGPMDETSKKIVRYVSGFSKRDLSPSSIHALNRTMLDTMACLISGFESDSVRICARLARSTRHQLKCTVLGYDLTTSPEMAAFANGSMIRFADFNDLGPGGHNSDIISALLAVGEALHCSGTDILVATAVGYELMGALADANAPNGGYGGGWDGPFNAPSVALAVGKLMGFNEDQLADALSLALVPHMPMLCSRIGDLSHWKGCHAPEASKSGVWAAMMVREGMTGPPQPFEARMGFFDHVGVFRELHLPLDPQGKMVVEMMGFKRTPADGTAQGVLELVPHIRNWTKPDEIASIDYEMPFAGWQALADPPKWDPRNSETADHSLPYLVSRALIDGQVYLDSFTPKKLEDPLVRQLMDKITVHPNPNWSGNAPARITVKKKSGEEHSWDSIGGLRNAIPGEIDTPLTDNEILAKFDQVCAFRAVSDRQRQHARSVWFDLEGVKDIANPIRDLARFGRPLPL